MFLYVLFFSLVPSFCILFLAFRIFALSLYRPVRLSDRSIFSWSQKVSKGWGSVAGIPPQGLV